MNYETMSDFEINKCVAEYAGMELSSDHSGAYVGVVRRSIGSRPNYGHVNYCNNPSDAWPIIFSSRIMLNPYCADELWKAEVPCGFDGFFKGYATCYHRNPLRAAMIVFLMMQDEDK